MSFKTHLNYNLKFFPFLFLISLIFGCASVQSPTGGPKDTKPPKVVEETPKNLTRNFAFKKIVIEFDEFIKLANEFTEISMSPAVDEMPLFKARRENLEITFEDTLEINTTYTINFGKAITDVNESNILTNYTYVFSTGPKIDSLSISGNVISALTKEKLLDATVFILPVKQDSLFGKKKASIFTTTDSSGNFKLQNLREDTYRLYALKEQGGDRIFNAGTDEIGFLNDTIILENDTSGLLLEVFKQDAQAFNIIDRKIDNDGRLSFAFNQSLLKPSLQIIEPKPLDANKTVEFNATRDSAFMWLPELNFDSITVAVADAGKNLDTVIVRKNKRDTYSKTISVSDNIISGRLKPRTPFTLTLSSPLASFDISKFTLLEDSVAVKSLQISKDTSSQRRVVLRYPWKTERNYILKLADNAFTDILGGKSKAYTKKFELDTDDSYGNLSVAVAIPDSSKSYIIQFLNAENKVLKSDPITENTTLTYLTYPTGKYRLRVIYDANKNEKWDTGNVYEKRQPETIWNFEKEITLRPNWDLEEKLVIPPLGETPIVLVPADQ